MKRYFQRFRDDRFALTTLQNPNIEVRTHAQLVQAAQPFVAQPLLAVQGAAQIAATQPLAAPDAPDSIPAVQLPVVEPLTAPAPDPTAPAPLDSASPVFASPDSVNNDAQQFLDSLVAGVLTAGSSLPSSPSLSSDDDELTAPPTTKPRRKAKSKSRRKSNRGTRNLACPERTRRACASSAASTEDQDPDPGDSPEPTPLERHARKCSICNHPHREYIEEAFLQWRSPDTIKRCWNLQSRTNIYHHAHAFNLFALRNRNLQLSLGNIIEDTDNHRFTTRDILHAIRVLAHVNEDGRWTRPTHKSEVTYSMQRLPAVAGLPVHPNALRAVAGEPKLIATQILNTDATH